MFVPQNPIIWLLLTVLDLYSWIVLAAVVMSWLLAFSVVNYHNNIVRGLVHFLEVMTEPVFRQVRRVIPTIGGIDLSPIVVFFAIIFLQKLIVYVYARFLPY
jgi:YggT family protein